MVTQHVTRRIAPGVLVILAALLFGCGNSADSPDAYGNFEATETVVSAQASGTLLAFDVEDGRILRSGEIVGQIDTLQLSLNRTQLLANRQALAARIRSVKAQVSVLEEEKHVTEIDRNRIDQLFADQAATRKQVDDIHGRLRVLEQQIRSTRSQTASLRAEIGAVDAQVAQLEDQIEKSRIVNPIDGTVLTSYAEPHELASFGKPLYRIADLSTMTLRAYVSGRQLSEIAIGMPVEIAIDDADGGTRRLNGELSWISSEAEFTPKHVQTREERVNLVYAFKVRVPNPHGVVKIGMPGEVFLPKAEQDS